MPTDQSSPFSVAPLDAPATFGTPGPLDGAPKGGLSPDQVAIDPKILERNIAAIAGRQPALARRLAQLTTPCAARFVETEEDGALTIEFDGRALTSRRRPLTEAQRLAHKIDLESHGGLLVLGFGAGHHCRAIAQHADGACAIVIFEPDLVLLRAVLERIDHSQWLAHGQVVIVTDPDDVGLLTADLKNLDALLSVGIDIVEHAPNLARLGDTSQRMIQTLTRAVGAMRMHVITAMVQSDVTARNQLMNVGHYASRPGIADLEGVAQGRPAILVAAGPSLRIALERLKDPAVRKRCVIIAVQTVLKPLLEAGIKPHFVTAIDYHEISKRFYEGLTPEDVEGVTLVAEARSNAAILDAFPGDIRLPRDEFLDLLLGTDPKRDGAPDRGKLPAAATVAHLSYYLARFMGCDPVLLCGQDLAFTDGQYYGPGAAIHNVWASELNPARTIEMLEWERIVRNKGHLHKVTDIFDRPVFTDDQMAAYLTQFERDFAADTDRGLTIVDASEGVRKRHTTPMPVDEAFEKYIPDTPLPDLPSAVADDSPKARQSTSDTIRKVRRQADKLHKTARECIDVLRTLQQDQGDPTRNTALVRKTHELRDRAQSLQPAFMMLTKLNQLGGFKRFKADRAIALAKHENQLAEQRARIERDIVNLEWIDEYSEVLEDLLGASERALRGAPKRTRDVTPSEDRLERVGVATKTRVGAVLHAGMSGASPDDVRATVERLRSAREIDEVIVLAPSDLPPIEGATVERTDPIRPETLRALRAGRSWALDNWRAGLANLSVFDEALDPASYARACDTHDLDSVYVCGASWTSVDPALTDRVIERHRESPGHLPIVFTQAPPGLCGCLIAKQGIVEMAQGRAAKRGSMHATMGGVLAYVPLAPRHDPIARPGCVQIDESLRDDAYRKIPDLAPDAPTELVLVPSDRERTIEHVDAFAQRAPGRLVSFEGAVDPLECAWLDEAVAHARDAGLLVHVRTGLRTDGAVQRLLDAKPDIVSIDAVCTTRETYEALTGVDAFERVKAGTEALLESRTLSDGLPTMWVVPRITRCDATYSEIEPFYDYWLTLAGAAIIDPLASPIEGQRIAPLPVPARAAQRLRVRRVFAGGCV